MPAKQKSGKPSSGSNASTAIRNRAKKLAETFGVHFNDGDTVATVKARADKQAANKGAKASPAGKHVNPAPSAPRPATATAQQNQERASQEPQREQSAPQREQSAPQGEQSAPPEQPTRRENDSLILTDHMRSASGLKCDQIPFLRGKSFGQPLGPEDAYAIRCNEHYEDGAAAIEGERTHARAAMLKAGSILVFFPNGKRPIIILSKFEQSNIKCATERATDAAKKRIRCMKRSASKTLKVEKGANPSQLRIIGKNADLEEIARKVPVESFWTVRNHHIEGISTAHVYMTDEVAKQVLDSFNVTIERVSNIVSSVHSSKQLTIRKDNTTFEDMTDVIGKLQRGQAISSSKAASTTYRTHGTLRVTLDVDVTSSIVNELRRAFPGYSVFSDTPLNAWAPGSNDAKPAAPRKPVQEGTKLINISANYQPHPLTFEAIAKAWGGKVHTIRDNKYTDRAMSALIAVPREKDLSEFLGQDFAIDDDGLWTAHAVGSAYSV